MTREEYKDLTQEEKKEVKVELWNVVKEAVAKNEDAVAALKVLRPSLYNLGSGPRAAGTPAKWKIFADSFEKKGDQIDELELFKALKVGRKEANGLVREVIRKSMPNERKWIHFDPEAEVYELIAIGEKAPKDWTGALPMVEVLDDELV